MTEEPFDNMLKQRNFMPASNNLAERIIATSRKMEQKQSLWQWVVGVFAEFHSPQPAYAFASLLLVGAVIGFVVSDWNKEAEVPSQYAYQDFLYADKDLL